MHYYMYDMSRWALDAVAPATRAAQLFWTHPYSPLSQTPAGRAAAACGEIFERSYRRHTPPPLSLRNGTKGEARARPRVVSSHRFGRLLHLSDETTDRPRMLVVNPLSGHFSSLFEDLYCGLLDHVDLYVAEWKDARDVPARDGSFTLDDQITCIEDYLRRLGPALHVLAFSQSTVPVLAAATLAAAQRPTAGPRSLTLMAGPLDPRINPNALNDFIASHPIAWFEGHLTAEVPFYYRGAGRRVFPGFLQLATYISASLDDQLDAHTYFLRNRISGNGAGVQAHRDFFDRFYAVMDLPAEFFHDTVKRIFREAALARGTLVVGGRQVDTSRLRETALFTVEASDDDLAGPGQTHAGHEICQALPKSKRHRLTLDQAGHIDTVRGPRWRDDVLPELLSFVHRHG